MWWNTTNWKCRSWGNQESLTQTERLHSTCTNISTSRYIQMHWNEVVPLLRSWNTSQLKDDESVKCLTWNCEARGFNDNLTNDLSHIGLASCCTRCWPRMQLACISTWSVVIISYCADFQLNSRHKLDFLKRIPRVFSANMVHMWSVYIKIR